MINYFIESYTIYILSCTNGYHNTSFCKFIADPVDHNYGKTMNISIEVPFPVGSTNSSVTITAFDDNIIENMETFKVDITSTSDPANILIEMNNHTIITIEDINTFNVFFKDKAYNISEDCVLHKIPIVFQLPGNGSQVNITVAVDSNDISATCEYSFIHST